MWDEDVKGFIKAENNRAKRRKAPGLEGESCGGRGMYFLENCGCQGSAIKCRIGGAIRFYKVSQIKSHEGTE